MARLSIELTQEQHRAIKALCSIRGMKMKDYVIEKLFEEKTFRKQTEIAIKEATTNKNLKKIKNLDKFFDSL